MFDFWQKQMRENELFIIRMKYVHNYILCQTHAQLRERFFLRHFVAFKQEISRAMVEMYLCE